MVELWRVDICTEVSHLVSYLAMPREGHLEAVIHIMSYLKQKHNSRLVLDPYFSENDKDGFISDVDWRPFYGDVKEAMPPSAPKSLLRKEVELCMFVDFFAFPATFASRSLKLQHENQITRITNDYIFTL